MKAWLDSNAASINFESTLGGFFSFGGRADRNSRGEDGREDVGQRFRLAYLNALPIALDE
jgi:hypothetical protein